MAHCYQCGRYIEPSKRYQRRRVKTGDSQQRRYPQESVKAFRKTYGQRIVCIWCAKRIDQRDRQKEVLDILLVVLALLLVTGLIALQ